MKTCEALANDGAVVELVVPNRKTHIKENPFEYYSVMNIFLLKKYTTPDLTSFGFLGFLFSQFFFGMRTIFNHADVIISQDELVLLWHILLGRRCVYEVHNGRWNRVSRVVAHRSVLLVANSQGTKNFYVAHGIPESKIFVQPNGVDIERFDISETSEEVRHVLRLPIDKKLILYTGHLYDWKGVDTLAESAQSLPNNAVVVFVGGTESDMRDFKDRYGGKENILILGHRPNSSIPLYLRSADVLVLPNNKIGESEQFTSPMKLFEYLAAGKPIIASNLPSVREVLDEQNAFFFSAGDSDSLAAMIMDVLDAPNESSKRAARARRDAEKYTWDREVLVQKFKELV